MPPSKMWYNCGNCHKFCGFLAVRLITVSCVGYLSMFAPCLPGNRGKYPTYDTATCLTTRNPQNLWQLPQLYHILKAGTVRSSIICWVFASVPRQTWGKQRQIPNTWYCYESDHQKPTKFMAVTTVVPHLKSRHLLDIPISLLHPKWKEKKKMK